MMSLLDAIQGPLMYIENALDRVRRLFGPFSGDIVEPLIGLTVEETLRVFWTAVLICAAGVAAFTFDSYNDHVAKGDEKEYYQGFVPQFLAALLQNLLVVVLVFIIRAARNRGTPAKELMMVGEGRGRPEADRQARASSRTASPAGNVQRKKGEPWRRFDAVPAPGRHRPPLSM